MTDKNGGLGLSICANYILDHRSGATEPFPQELQEIFILCVQSAGFAALEKVGKERFVELLNHLNIGIKDLRLRE